MKRFFAFLLMVITVICLFACGKDNAFSHPSFGSDPTVAPTENPVEPTTPPAEIHGVPESLILRNVSIGENVTYEITHNYDAATHIDDVLLTTSYNSAFGVQTMTYTYAYQYNRLTDLWTLIDGNNGLQSDTITFSKESYMNNCRFTGEFDQNHKGSYTITIKDLDLTGKTATIEYFVMFSDDYSILSDTKTFELLTTQDGKGLGFVIPYTRSRVVMFRLVFLLDIDTGLQA